MRRLRFLFLVFLFFISSTVVFAGNAQVHKVILDNGLTVLTQPLPSSETISIDAYVKTGSAIEGKYSGAGISHFVEHMLFKGTSKRGVGRIAQEVKNLGGEINAQTSFDHTMYTLQVPKGLFKQGLAVIGDMVMNSAFDPSQVDKEREVIHSEMRLYHDRPENQLSELTFKNVYAQHPYRHPIIGYQMLFDQITRDQLFEYYKTRYVPNNIILSIAGAVEPGQILPFIRETFKDFKPLPYPDRNLAQEPPQITPRFYKQEYPTPLYRFSFSYQGVSILDPDLYALDVLAMALGQGQSSRLYQDVYKKKHLVEGISASNFTPQDKGFFEIEGVMTKDHVQEVQSAVETIVTDIKRQGLNPQELEKTKRQVLSQFIFANQTPYALAARNAMDEAMTGDYEFSKHYVDMVKAVGNEDIKRVANCYLNKNHATLIILSPQVPQLQGPAKQEAVKTPIERIVLDNGLTLLIHEDHSVGTVAINAVMNAGTRQETEALNGISELTARVWGKGGKKWDSQHLAWEVERRGGTLGAYAGRNTIGLKINMLSDDTLFALDLLEDLIKTPCFDPQIINEERMNMLAAIQERDDDVASAAFKELNQTLFLKHPYRLDSLGTTESLQRITGKDIAAYYHRFAVPNNMVIAIFGDFDGAKVKGLLKQKFHALTKSDVHLPQFSEEPPRAMRQKDLTTAKEQAVVAWGFQAPRLNDKDRFSMEIIDGILGSSLSGRLFVKVRDELGKAYTLGSDYIPGIDTGLFSIYVLTTNDKIEVVKTIVMRELENLRANRVVDEELQSVKNYLKGTFKMNLDTPAAVGTASSLNELYGLGYDFHERFDQNIDAVTIEDLQRVARDYLDINKAAMVVTRAKKKIEQ